MSVQINTSRGIYQLSPAAPSVEEGGAVVLTLAVERVDGIERVVFRCRIAQGLLESSQIVAPSCEPGTLQTEELLRRLSPWLEREFEQVREAALKSIRTERRLFELGFDAALRGPF